MKKWLKKIITSRTDYAGDITVPWWKFWNFRSGLVGGMILGAILTAVHITILILIRSNG